MTAKVRGGWAGLGAVAEILLSWARALVPGGTPSGLHLPMPGRLAPGSEGQPGLAASGLAEGPVASLWPRGCALRPVGWVGVKEGPGAGSGGVGARIPPPSFPEPCAKMGAAAPAAQAGAGSVPTRTLAAWLRGGGPVSSPEPSTPEGSPGPRAPFHRRRQSSG